MIKTSFEITCDSLQALKRRTPLRISASWSKSWNVVMADHVRRSNVFQMYFYRHLLRLWHSDRIILSEDPLNPISGSTFKDCWIEYNHTYSINIVNHHIDKYLIKYSWADLPVLPTWLPKCYSARPACMRRWEVDLRDWKRFLYTSKQAFFSSCLTYLFALARTRVPVIGREVNPISRWLEHYYDPSGFFQRVSSCP